MAVPDPDPVRALERVHSEAREGRWLGAAKDLLCGSLDLGAHGAQLATRAVHRIAEAATPAGLLGGAAVLLLSCRRSRS